MKNWRLKQELRELRSEYYFNNGQLHFFSRTDESGKEYHVPRNSVDIINNAIGYIEELEAKVDELSYAQKIIDVINKGQINEMFRMWS